MRNKKRLIGLIGLISLIFVVASSNTFTNFTPITATEKIYTLVLDGSSNKGSGVPTSYSSTVNTVGTAKTELGNTLTFKGANVMKPTEAGYFVQMKSSSGYYYNETAITGLKSINVTYNSVSKKPTIYFGTTSNPSSGSQTLESNTSISLDGTNSYFKIAAGGNALFISKITITYSCIVNGGTPSTSTPSTPTSTPSTPSTTPSTPTTSTPVITSKTLLINKTNAKNLLTSYNTSDEKVFDVVDSTLGIVDFYGANAAYFSGSNNLGGENQFLQIKGKDGGYLYNKDPLANISSIKVTYQGTGSVSLYTSNNTTSWGDGQTLSSGTTYTFVDSPSYFKIQGSSGTNYYHSIEIVMSSTSIETSTPTSTPSTPSTPSTTSTPSTPSTTSAPSTPSTTPSTPTSSTITIIPSNLTGWTSTGASQSGSYQGILLSTTNGLNSGSEIRAYADQTFTISSTIGKITQIVFTCTASNTSKYGPGNFSTSVGEYTYSGTSGTWKGNNDAITFNASAQVRMTKIVVTINGGSSISTPGSTSTSTSSPSTSTSTPSVVPQDKGYMAPNEYNYQSGFANYKRFT